MFKHKKILAAAALLGIIVLVGDYKGCPPWNTAQHQEYLSHKQWQGGSMPVGGKSLRIHECSDGTKEYKNVDLAMLGIASLVAAMMLFFSGAPIGFAFT